MAESNAASLQKGALHMHEVMDESETLLDHLFDAETGQHGFLLTLEPLYLQPFNAGTAKAWTQLPNKYGGKE